MTDYKKNKGAGGWCEFCEKLMYADRKLARHAAKGHTEHKSAYRCPWNELWWHIGGLPADIKRGHITRDEFYQRAG
jgi:hypothetical protein